MFTASAQLRCGTLVEQDLIRQEIVDGYASASADGSSSPPPVIPKLQWASGLLLQTDEQDRHRSRIK